MPSLTEVLGPYYIDYDLEEKTVTDYVPVNLEPITLAYLLRDLSDLAKIYDPDTSTLEVEININTAALYLRGKRQMAEKEEEGCRQHQAGLERLEAHKHTLELEKARQLLRKAGELL